MEPAPQKNTHDPALPSWWNGFVSRADSFWAKVTLAFAAFIDSWLFFIPPELFLSAVTLARPKRWLFYTLFTTFFTLLGAYFGYVLGALFFDSVGGAIVSFLGAEELLVRAQVLFAENAFWTLVITALSPIPFVPFVIAAGFFGVPLWIFTAAVLVGRFFRYAPIALLVSLFGMRGVMVLLRLLHGGGEVSRIITIVLLVLLGIALLYMML